MAKFSDYLINLRKSGRLSFTVEEAEMFFKGFKSDLIESSEDKKYLGRAAFELHQAVEYAYKTILLVFTNFNPNEHYLRILGRMSEKYSEDLKDLFPKKTQKDKDRFKLLDDAYIAGRYDPDFRISKQDLEILSKDVKELLRLTKESCERKINLNR